MTVGEKIRARRQELGMTMEDLGRAIGVQRSAINKYEKDLIKDPKLSTLAALAKALDVSPMYLMEDDDIDQERLEALHQNPRLGILFDHARKVRPEDVDMLVQLSEMMEKAIYGDD